MRDIEMLPIILILALGGTASALNGGSSVWFYSKAECSSLEARHDKSHQIYSKAMDIDRSTCWENEMDGVEYGARRRSIWIDPPVVANEAATDKTKGCLRLWFSGECGSGNPSATMTFTQSREFPVCYTFDPDEAGQGGLSGYAGYEISDGECDFPTIDATHFLIT